VDPEIDITGEKSPKNTDVAFDISFLPTCTCTCEVINGKSRALNAHIDPVFIEPVLESVDRLRRYGYMSLFRKSLVENPGIICLVQ